MSAEGERQERASPGETASERNTAARTAKKALMWQPWEAPDVSSSRCTRHVLACNVTSLDLFPEVVQRRRSMLVQKMLPRRSSEKRQRWWDFSNRLEACLMAGSIGEGVPEHAAEPNSYLQDIATQLQPEVVFNSFISENRSAGELCIESPVRQ